MDILKRFMLGFTQGLGMLAAFAVAYLFLAGSLPEKVEKVKNKIIKPDIYINEFDAGKYNASPILENHHQSLINESGKLDVPSTYQKVFVDNEQQLYEALKMTSGNVAIYVAPGQYKFRKALQISKPNTMILSQSSSSSAVEFNGRGMKSGGGVNNLIEINSSGAVIDGITLQNVGNHLIQIRAETNSDFPVIRNTILRNSYEQMIKVSYDKINRPGELSDTGLIENCLFEYTAGVGPNYYIGGIDAHGIRNWTIRNNIFKNIASPNKRISEHAIHLWNNTENNLVENNIIIDSDRAIGFGMETKVKGNENIKYSNYGGVIRNNFIYHSDNRHEFSDVGIILENSPNTLVEGNYVYMEHTYRRAIEYRFEPTKGVIIKDNYANKSISSRDGGKASLVNNKSITKVDFFVALNTFLSENNVIYDHLGI